MLYQHETIYKGMGVITSFIMNSLCSSFQKGREVEISRYSEKMQPIIIGRYTGLFIHQDRPVHSHRALHCYAPWYSTASNLNFTEKPASYVRLSVQFDFSTEYGLFCFSSGRIDVLRWLGRVEAQCRSILFLVNIRLFHLSFSKWFLVLNSL